MHTRTHGCTHGRTGQNQHDSGHTTLGGGIIIKSKTVKQKQKAVVWAWSTSYLRISCCSWSKVLEFSSSCGASDAGSPIFAFLLNTSCILSRPSLHSQQQTQHVTRELWMQRITFTVKTNVADTHTHTVTQYLLLYSLSNSEGNNVLTDEWYDAAAAAATTTFNLCLAAGRSIFPEWQIKLY